jgi:hypothetical protein
MSLGFSDADSVPCSQHLDLTPTDLVGEPIALKLTKVSDLALGGRHQYYGECAAGGRNKPLAAADLGC